MISNSCMRQFEEGRKFEINWEAGGSTGNSSSKQKTARPACHLNIQLERLAKEKLNKTEQQQQYRSCNSREPLQFMIGGAIFFLHITMHCSSDGQLSVISLLVGLNLCNASFGFRAKPFPIVKFSFASVLHWYVPDVLLSTPSAFNLYTTAPAL